MSSASKKKPATASKPATSVAAVAQPQRVVGTVPLPKSPTIKPVEHVATRATKKKAPSVERDDDVNDKPETEENRRSVRSKTLAARPNSLEAAMQTAGADLAKRNETVATAAAPGDRVRRSSASSGSNVDDANDVLWSFSKPPPTVDAVVFNNNNASNDALWALTKRPTIEQTVLDTTLLAREAQQTTTTSALGGDPLEEIVRTIAATTKMREVAGVDPLAQSNADPLSNLSQPGLAYLVDVEEMVRQGLATLVPGARQGMRLLTENEAKQPFVVRGLSQEVDNPKWKFMQERRGVLLGQKGFIQRQKEKLATLWLERRDPSIFTLEARSKFQQRSAEIIDSFGPPRTFTQLKPAFEVRELDALWRKLLGGVIEGLYVEFVLTTVATLEKTLPAAQKATASVLAHVLVDQIVKPVFDRKLAELEKATFEDMPLTQERVMYYFFRYMSAALFRLMNPVQAPTAQQVREALDDNINQMSLFPDDDAVELGDVFYVPGDTEAEKTELLVYFGSVFTLYASPRYRDYFKIWIETLPPDVIATSLTKITDLRGYMNRAIDLNLTQRSTGYGKNPERYYRFYDPMSESEVSESFYQLMLHEVALRRARLIKDEVYVAEQFRDFLTSDVGTASLDDKTIFFAQTRDFLPILDEVYESEVALLFGPAMDVNSAANRLLKSRYDTLVAHIERFGNRGSIARAPHGPLDPGSFPFNYEPGDPGDPGAPAQPEVLADPGDPNAVPPRPPTVARPAIPARPARPVVPPSAPSVPYSMFDLAYPLDRDLARATIDELITLVRIEAAQFDPVAANERATARRVAVDENYAKRVLDRELAQVDYMLNKVLTEKLEAAAVVQHMIGSHQTIVLVVRLELSPVIAARIQNVPQSSQLATDKEVVRRLERGQFRVKWFHQSPYFAVNGGKERELMTDVLDESYSAALRLYTSGDMSDVVALAGIYRAEVQQINPDNGGQVIGEVFKSLYNETVVVFAKCVRDGVVYQPTLNETGEKKHSECKWEENPHNEQFTEELEDLRVLVAYGAAPAKKRRDERRQIGAREEQFLLSRGEPPWGSSAEESLTLLYHQSENDKKTMFSFENIVGMYVQRMSQIIAVIAPQYGDFGAKTARETFLGLAFAQVQYALNQLPGGSDVNLKLESALDQSMVVMPVGASDNVTFLVANKTKTPVELALLFNDMWTARLTNGVRRATTAPAIGLPGGSRTLQHVHIDFSTFAMQNGLADLPFATVLMALRLPAQSILATPREQRFFANALADFLVFDREYRACKRAETFRPAVSAEKELSMMTLTEVRSFIQYHSKTMSARLKDTDVFSDRASLKEFEYLVKTTGALPFRLGKREWLGTHSFDSFQPDMAHVRALPASLRDALGNPLTLYVARRGSEPARRYYDYAGLFKMIVDRIKSHNALPPDRVPERVVLASGVGQAVTVYNYFAFLAQPEMVQKCTLVRFVSAGEIYDKIDHRTGYQNLHFESSLYF
jgi:hypothetical protein